MRSNGYVFVKIMIQNKENLNQKVLTQNNDKNGSHFLNVEILVFNFDTIFLQQISGVIHNQNIKQGIFVSHKNSY